MARWHFDLENGSWVWCLYDGRGGLVRKSENRFDYYLDAVADARRHGFEGHLSTPGDPEDASHRND